MDHRLLVATDDGVVVAHRQNGVWQEAYRTLVSRPVTSVSAQGDSILAGTRRGIHRSPDTGQTWQMASEGLTIPHIRWLAHYSYRFLWTGDWDRRGHAAMSRLGETGTV